MARRSNDKASRSHIEQLRYADPAVSPGDSVRYSDLHDSERVTWYEHVTVQRSYGPGTETIRHSGAGVPCTIIEPTECGVYSGNALVGESNYRCMKKEFPWLVEVYGSHGYRALAYLGKRENQSDALIEAIDSLTDSSCYSDDDHSRLELERADEAWETDGADEFADALADIFEHADPDFEHEARECDREMLYSLWRDGCELYNVNGGSGYVNEQGDSIYFYIDEWVSRYEREPDRAHTWSVHNAHETMAERIAALARTCRVHSLDESALAPVKDAFLSDDARLQQLLADNVPEDYHTTILTAWARERAREGSAQ